MLFRKQSLLVLLFCLLARLASAAANVFVVNKTTDDGSANTLRWAINQVNLTDENDDNEIRFDFGSGSFEIELDFNNGDLPPINRKVFINGAYGRDISSTGPEITVNFSLLNGFQLLADDNVFEGLNLKLYDDYAIKVSGWNSVIRSNVLLQVKVWDVIGGSNHANYGRGIWVYGGNNTLIEQNIASYDFLFEDGASVSYPVLVENSSYTLIRNNTLISFYIPRFNLENRFHSGKIMIIGSSYHTEVYGNYLGNNGAKALGSGAFSHGVYVTSGPLKTFIGKVGEAPNVISGNAGFGIFLDGASDVYVKNNYIGTNAAGTGPFIQGGQPRTNWDGIVLDNSSNIEIGGTETGASNLISGNQEKGVWFRYGNDNVRVLGNKIGTTLDGLSALPNRDGIAFITLQDNPNPHPAGPDATGVHFETSTRIYIGGDTEASGNLISGNTSLGIWIYEKKGSVYFRNNKIGTDITGNAPLKNDYGIFVNKSFEGVWIGGLKQQGNLVSGNDKDGIHIINSANIRVNGNRIGTSADNMLAVPNNNGIRLHYSNNCVIGENQNYGNVISGNAEHGITLYSSSSYNVIRGNFVGTNSSGNVAIPNNHGIYWDGGCIDNQIGGKIATEGNLISGNTNYGIYARYQQNIVEGNRIGTDLSGENFLPNRSGIYLYYNNGTRIGGLSNEYGNLIRGNTEYGINALGTQSYAIVMYNNFIQDNGFDGLAMSPYSNNWKIGMAYQGNTFSGNGGSGINMDSCYSNRISGNSFYNNDSLAINLNLIGAMPANLAKARPAITKVTYDRGLQMLMVEGMAEVGDTVELFSSAAVAQTAYQYLGRSLPANSSGIWKAWVTGGTALNGFLVATATREKNTSQLSEVYSYDFCSAPPVLLSDLKAYYPFSGNANDLSGNGYDGAVSGATLTTDRFGNASSAYQFDGVDDYIECIDLKSATDKDEFSIAFWFKGTSLRSGVRNQISSHSISVGYNNSGAWPVPGNSLSFDGGSASPSVFTGTNVQDNQWHHIALTWKRGTVNGFRSYVDGVLVNQRNSADNAIPAFTSNFFIGSFNGIGSFTHGALDDVYIYSRFLSSEEIGYLYTGAMGELITLTGPADYTILAEITPSHKLQWKLNSLPELNEFTDTKYTFIVQAAPQIQDPETGELKGDWGGAEVYRRQFSENEITFDVYEKELSYFVSPSKRNQTWYWRVGLQYMLPDENGIQPVQWSDVRTILIDKRLPDIPADYLTSSDPESHTDNINWVYEVTYLNDGKTAQSISYMDGLGKTRQRQVFSNTTGQVLATETVYSEEGNAPVTSMVAPVNNRKFGYAHRFFDVYQSGVWEDFSTAHFDRETVGSSYNTPRSPVAADNTVKGSVANYYSDNNPWEQYVDDAGGYPYQYSLSYQDPLGRPLKAAGLGDDFRINSGREVVFLNSGVTKAELSQVYGATKAAQMQKYVSKDAVIDPNGITSISYKDEKGNTIATAMTACETNPIGLDPLTEDGMASFVSGLSVLDNDQLNAQSRSKLATANILITCGNQEVDLDYSIDLGAYSTTDGFCAVCAYEVNFRVVEDQTGLVVFEETEQLPHNGANVDCDNATDVFTWQESVVLPRPGTYTIYRHLRPQIDQATGRLVLETLIEQQDSIFRSQRESLKTEFRDQYYSTEAWYAMRKLKTDGGDAGKPIMKECVNLYAGDPDNSGSVDGDRLSSAQFSNARAMDIDKNDNVYVLDGGNIRKISTDGQVITIFNSGSLGLGPIYDITVDNDNGVYFSANAGIYKVDSLLFATLIYSKTGVYGLEYLEGAIYFLHASARHEIKNINISKVSTSGSEIRTDYIPGGFGVYELYHYSLVVKKQNDYEEIYLHSFTADGSFKSSIYQVNSLGELKLYADTPAGYNDGMSPQLFTVKGLAKDKYGDIYITDDTYIRRLNTHTGWITTYAGTVSSNTILDPIRVENFSGTNIQDLDFDSNGNLYYTNGRTVRVIKPCGFTDECEEKPAVTNITLKATSPYRLAQQPGDEANRGRLHTHTPNVIVPNWIYIDASRWTVSGNWFTRRALFDFDFSQIPAGATIVDAKLYLYGHGDASWNNSILQTTNECWLERVTESYNKYTVAWDNQPATTSLNRVEVPASNVLGQNAEFNVKAIVQDMVNYPDQSHGFMMRLKTEGGNLYRTRVFASSAHPDPARHPRLEVAWVNGPLDCAGLSSTATYASVDLYADPAPMSSATPILLGSADWLREMTEEEFAAQLAVNVNLGTSAHGFSASAQESKLLPGVLSNRLSVSAPYNSGADYNGWNLRLNTDYASAVEGCFVLNGSNLIYNSAMEASLGGISSDYQSAAVNSPGYYILADNAMDFHSSLPSVTDHTGGGDFVIAKGDTVAGAMIWKQGLSVEKNTNYIFSLWAISLTSENPSSLQLKVNGMELGSPVTLTGQWREIRYLWNSGANTVANLSIQELSRAATGNVFGIDDIMFEKRNISEGFFANGADGECETIRWYMDQVSLEDIPASTDKRIVDLDGKVGGVIGAETLQIADPGTPVAAPTAMRDAFIAEYRYMHWVDLSPDDIVSMEVYTAVPGKLPVINDDKTLESALEDFYLIKVAFRSPSCEDKCMPVEFDKGCDEACHDRLQEFKAFRQEAYVGLSEITGLISYQANLYTLKQLVDNFYPFGESLIELFEDEENDLEAAYEAYLTYEMGDFAVQSFDPQKCVNVCVSGGADAENICISCQSTYSRCVGDNITELTEGHDYLITRWEDEAGFPYATINDMDSDEIGKLGTYLSGFLEAEFSNAFVKNINNWYLTAGEANNDCSNCDGPPNPNCNSLAWNVSKFPDILLSTLETANEGCLQEYDICIGLATNPTLTLCEKNQEDCIAIIPEGLSTQDYQDYYDQCLIASDCSGDLSGVEEAERKMMIYEVQKELHVDHHVIMTKTEEVYQQTLNLTLPELAVYLFDYKDAEQCRLACVGQFEEAFNFWYEQQLYSRRDRIEEAFLSQCYTGNEAFTVTFEQSYYHYTLYEYDEAGRLIGTVPPEGIDFVDTDNPDPLISGRAPEHRMRTLYTSNSLNQLMVSESPDGGEIRYLYDKAGRIRFSQSAEQVQRGTDQNLFIFSYTNYDPETGRITEIGEFRTDRHSRDAYDWQRPPGSMAPVQYINGYVDNFVWPWDASRCFEQSYFYYDTPMLTGLEGVDQENTRERVSKVANAHGATYYSYDERGRAKTVVQELLDPEEEAMRFKTIDYTYDMLTSQVTQVVYQKGVSGEEFAHKYVYDEDNRLSEVFVAREQKSRAAYISPYEKGAIHAENFEWNGGPVTIEFWVKVNTGDAMNGYLFRVGSGQPRMQAQVPYGDNAIYWDYGMDGGIGRSHAVFSGAFQNKWTHVALVSEGIGGGFKGIYLDGALMYSGTVSDGVITKGNLRMGQNWKGMIDDFRIWDKVLSQEEIAGIINENTDLPLRNLKLHWNFDEPDGNTIRDVVGNCDAYAYTQYVEKIDYDRSGASVDYAWERVSQYEYYMHGSLKSKGLGDYVQKLDYVYNLQGWLKSINHPLRGRDPGMDQYVNTPYMRDVFGEILNYYAGDYKRTGSGLLAADAVTPAAGTHVKNKGKDLFNGNISSIVTYTAFDQAGESTDPLMAQGYRYDYLNRLVSTFTETGTLTAFGGWSASSVTLDNIYQENLSYDANGNIASLERTAFKRTVNSVQTTAMDMMTYHYDQSLTNSLSQSKKAHNKLLYIDDAAADDLNIEDFTDQASGNYVYDAKGRLIKDLANEIDSIAWTAYDKVKEVFRTDGSSKPHLLYTYDGFGRRLSKTVTLPGQESRTSYYVYDGGGNQMALYLQDQDESEEIRYRLVEHVLYGASREGVYKNGVQIGAESVTTTLEKSALLFEVSDHLGNVRAVVSGQKVTAADIPVYQYHFGFESAQDAPDQYWDSWVFSKDEKYSGEQSVYVTGFGHSVYVPVEPGDTISAEAMMKFVSGTQGGFIYMALQDENGQNEIGSRSSQHNLASHQQINTWSHIQYPQFIVPAGKYRLLFYLRVYAGEGNSPSWFDDFKVTVRGKNTRAVEAAEVISLTDYYPFGMAMPGRSISNSEEYRYGFNGMEKDDEVKGEGNSYDFGARIYDPRMGRWLAVDPLSGKFPGFTPYSFVNNMVINSIDPDGRDIIVLNDPKGAKRQGHHAILIGDDTNGWTYISKDGTLNGVGMYGEPIWVLRTFNTIEEFRNSAHNFVLSEGYVHSNTDGTENTDVSFKLDSDGNKILRYTRAYYIPTTQSDGTSTDFESQNAATQSAITTYCLTLGDCSDIVTAALAVAKTNTGERVVTGHVSFVPLFGTSILNIWTERPNTKHRIIVQFNKNIQNDRALIPDDLSLKKGEVGKMKNEPKPEPRPKFDVSKTTGVDR